MQQGMETKTQHSHLRSQQAAAGNSNRVGVQRRGVRARKNHRPDLDTLDDNDDPATKAFFARARSVVKQTAKQKAQLRSFYAALRYGMQALPKKRNDW